MVVITRGIRPLTSREVARRQADIRSHWTPGERRERARQAAAQMGLLWALINSRPTAR